jgi:hypothetical protein
VLDERAVAVTVVPDGNREYARDRQWLRPDAEYDHEDVVSNLHAQVAEPCPHADFRHLTVGRYASPGRIATELKKAVRSADASVVFVGSENAGHLAE